MFKISSSDWLRVPRSHHFVSQSHWGACFFVGVGGSWIIEVSVVHSFELCSTYFSCLVMFFRRMFGILILESLHFWMAMPVFTNFVYHFYQSALFKAYGVGFLTM